MKGNMARCAYNGIDAGMKMPAAYSTQLYQVTVPVPREQREAETKLVAANIKRRQRKEFKRSQKTLP